MFHSADRHRADSFHHLGHLLLVNVISVALACVVLILAI